MPTIEHLFECFDVNFEKGLLTWKKRPLEHFKTKHACNAWNTRHAGTTAGSPTTKNYLKVGLQGKFLKVHRVIWAMFHKVWPNGTIDHENRKPDNNWIKNLREATRSEQAANRNMQRSNTSGFRGVFLRKDRTRHRWFAQIEWQGRSYFLGYFATPEEASVAYLRKQKELHGEFVPT